MSDENDMNNNAGDSTIAEYATYEDYLDSQITPLDMYYLEVIIKIIIIIIIIPGKNIFFFFFLIKYFN